MNVFIEENEEERSRGKGGVSEKEEWRIRQSIMTVLLLGRGNNHNLL
jgi:hypothetical protein